MSYDLTFRPREGTLDEDAFVDYFNGRMNYRFPDEEPEVAAYFNPSTEVYFHFRWVAPDEAEPRGALEFSINLFRPPTFAIEAETELADLVLAFDVAVGRTTHHSSGTGPTTRSR